MNRFSIFFQNFWIYIILDDQINILIVTVHVIVSTRVSDPH